MKLMDVRTYVEAAIDFPEEEIDFLADPELVHRLEGLRAAVSATLADARQGRMLRDGLVVVIAGAPNVGKSTLMNRLSGRDAAIVTDIPGTTRDTLHETLHFDGLPVRLTDTAGLRAAADEVERIGVDRARAAIADADAVLHLVDDRDPETPPDAVPEDRSRPGTVARAQQDRPHGHATRSGRRRRSPGAADFGPNGRGPAGAARSAEGGRRLPVRRGGDHSSPVAATSRPSRKPQRQSSGDSAQLAESGAGELLAEDLREAQNALGRITGAVTIKQR